MKEISVSDGGSDTSEYSEQNYNNVHDNEEYKSIQQTESSLSSECTEQSHGTYTKEDMKNYQVESRISWQKAYCYNRPKSSLGIRKVSAAKDKIGGSPNTRSF